MLVNIVQNGITTNAILVPDGATIAADGASASWTGGGYAPPAGATLALQAGPLVGWTLAGGMAAAPPAGVLSAAQLRSYASGKLTNLLATPRVYVLASGVSVLANATTSTGADLSGVNAWGSVNSTATMSWVDDLGAVTSITGAEGVALANQVVAFAQSVYAALAAALQGIAAGTLTTTAEVDALGWPT